MLNLLEGLQSIIEFIASIWDSAVSAIQGLSAMMGNIFSLTAVYGANTPLFIVPFAGVVFFLAGAALVIRIMPFFG